MESAKTAKTAKTANVARGDGGVGETVAVKNVAFVLVVMDEQRTQTMVLIKREIFDVLLAGSVLLLGIRPKSIEPLMSQTPLIVCNVNRKGAQRTQKFKTSSGVTISIV